MDINTRTEKDILILSLEGSLDTSTAAKVEAEANKSIETYTKVIMDLSSTSFVSSAGLRVFLSTAKQLMAVGGKFRLCGANDVVNEILEISGFNQIIEVKPNLDEALANF